MDPVVIIAALFTLGVGLGGTYYAIALIGNLHGLR